MGAERSLEFHPCGILRAWLRAVTGILPAGAAAGALLFPPLHAVI